MKKSTHLIPLLIGAFCAPLAAATLLQSPVSTPPMDKCPDMGVQMVDAAFTPTQMAACEFGFLHYEGFGLDLTWEDPVCPLSVIWEPAYSSVVAKPNMTVELLLYAEFDIFTIEQHSAVNEALASGSRTATMLELSNESTLRQQLLNAYFVSGTGENAQVLNLSVVEWIARLDNNPLIKQQAIDFLLSISQGEGEAIANSIIGEKDFIIKYF